MIGPKGEGYISDLGTAGVQLKIWVTISPSGEGKTYLYVRAWRIEPKDLAKVYTPAAEITREARTSKPEVRASRFRTRGPNAV